jgi:fructokinase
VTVADTVGAGDASMGGWIARLLQGLGVPAPHQLAFAAATAAVVCSRTGACAPTREEVAAVLAAGRI